MAALPAVHRLLDEPRIARFVPLLGAAAVKQRIDVTLGRARSAAVIPDAASIVDDVVTELTRESRMQLTGVLNGTGILLHTNLGRAPLASEAIDAIARLAGGASNLEYDIESGERGSRHERVRSLLRAVTGAQDALVVNNCAAAVLLVLDTFARAPHGERRDVVVARNELVEIGGGFRLPDVLARSGAQLIEVGTANKVRLDDYARALTPQTALIMRAHRANFTLSGFVAEVTPRDLVALGRRAGIAVLEDLGSGALSDLRAYGLPPERTVAQAVDDGFDLIAFSADKLLGGPQAGILVGRTAAIARVASNPLLRALRVGSATLAALSATLALHRNDATREHIPFYAMLGVSLTTLRTRAEALQVQLPDLALQIVEHDAYAGGGTLPMHAIPSLALAWKPVDGATAGAARLRACATPVVTQVAGDLVLIDLRTIAARDDDALVAALAAAAG